MRGKYEKINYNDIKNKNLGKIFHVILEVTHLLNGIFQNVQERYTIHEVVEHPFFINILYPDNRFFKPFQNQVTIMDEERVCLFSHRSKGSSCEKSTNPNFDCFKYVRICAENVLHKNEVF